MNYPKQHRGASLIEVLVTVLILATSLLAIAALQTRSLQYNHSAFIRSQANIIAYDVIDRMRIASPAAPAAVVKPSDTVLETIQSALPDGEVEVDGCPNRLCTVTVTWAEEDATDKESRTSTFTYTTQL